MWLNLTTAVFVMISIASLIALFKDYETSKWNDKLTWGFISLFEIFATIGLLQKVFCGC